MRRETGTYIAAEGRFEEHLQLDFFADLYDVKF